jgi:5,6-dimethylbenzimidazole synthase
LSPVAHAFVAEEAEAVYRAIHERRDMRHFAGGQVAPDVLCRLLEAAHHAPSVGFMQPWRFIRVRDAAMRQRLHDGVERERVLTARAEGLGMGWVSLFDPAELSALLGLPDGAEPIALLCLGPVPGFYDEPMLQRERWARRAPLSALVFDERWGRPSALFAAAGRAEAA